jgi:hypothetical protein
LLELCWGRAECRRQEAPRADFSPAPDSRLSINRRERRHQLARYEHAPRHVIEARYLGDYKVWLEFNDGRKGVVDLSDELHGDELEPLRDRDRFAQFYLDYGLASIAWLDGQDFKPEFLYEKLKEMH